MKKAAPVAGGGKEVEQEAQECSDPISATPAIEVQAPADLDKLADDGVTDDDEAARRRHAICNASITAECCAKCQRSLKPEEPIWRAKHTIGYHPFQAWLAPVCSDCRSDRHSYWDPLPCGGCGRPVHNITFQPPPSCCFCCQRCAPAARAARARERRRLARCDRSCERCGETFEPKRADAKFCSSACRQAAYRHRVTDSMRLSTRPLNN